MSNIIMLIIPLILLLSFRASGQNAGSKTGKSIDTTKFTSYKMKYPGEARRKRIQGTVKIKMTFDSQCNVAKKEVVKSLGYGCDEEALIALTHMEERIKKAKGYKCKEGEELIYPINFKLN
jgi:TonB family protein